MFHLAGYVFVNPSALFHISVKETAQINSVELGGCLYEPSVCQIQSQLDRFFHDHSSKLVTAQSCYWWKVVFSKTSGVEKKPLVASCFLSQLKPGSRSRLFLLTGCRLARSYPDQQKTIQLGALPDGSVRRYSRLGRLLVVVDLNFYPRRVHRSYLLDEFPRSTT